MSDDLHQVGQALSDLLAKAAPGRRRSLMLVVAKDLQRANVDRIAGQVDADGTPFTPRKRREEPPLRSKSGRIRRRVKARAMFLKIRKGAYLKAEASPDEASAGFSGRTAAIARVHQEGLADKVGHGRRAIYPQRRLLGVSESDRGRVLDRVLEHLED